MDFIPIGIAVFCMICTACFPFFFITLNNFSKKRTSFWKRIKAVLLSPSLLLTYAIQERLHISNISIRLFCLILSFWVALEGYVLSENVSWIFYISSGYLAFGFLFHEKCEYPYNTNPNLIIIYNLVFLCICVCLAHFDYTFLYSDRVQEVRELRSVSSYQTSMSSSISSSSHGSYSSERWGENTTTIEITGDLSRTAYWTPRGKSYHFSRSCPSLSRSQNVKEGTLQEAINAGKTDPCNNCAY